MNAEKLLNVVKYIENIACQQVYSKFLSVDTFINLDKFCFNVVKINT